MGRSQCLLGLDAAHAQRHHRQTAVRPSGRPWRQWCCGGDERPLPRDAQGPCCITVRPLSARCDGPSACGAALAANDRFCIVRLSVRRTAVRPLSALRDGPGLDRAAPATNVRSCVPRAMARCIGVRRLSVLCVGPRALDAAPWANDRFCSARSLARRTAVCRPYAHSVRQCACVAALTSMEGL